MLEYAPTHVHHGSQSAEPLHRCSFALTWLGVHSLGAAQIWLRLQIVMGPSAPVTRRIAVVSEERKGNERSQRKKKDSKQGVVEEKQKIREGGQHQ